MAIDTKKLRELAEKAGSGEWSATDGIVWFDDGDGALKVMNPIPTFFAFDNMGAWPDAIESDDVAAYAAAACPKTVLALLDEIDAFRKEWSIADIPPTEQEWAKIDPAVAFHLIERHAENWGDAGRMMEAWRDATLDAALALRESGNEDQT